MRHLRNFNIGFGLPALLLFSGSLVLPFAQPSEAMPRTNSDRMVSPETNFSTTTPPSVFREFQVENMTPVNGEVTIKLVNEMNTPVTYEVVGDTSDRQLSSDSMITLRSIEAPTTLTFYRPDGGFINAIPETTEETGVLQITLKEAFDLDNDAQALRINEQGAVYLY